MANKPFILQNFKVIECKKFEGTTKKGSDYVKFALTIDHEKAPADKFEFRYFADPTAPETWPYPGVAVKEMVGEVGQYQGKDQYNVKKIIYDQSPKKPEPKPDPEPKPTKPYPKQWEDHVIKPVADKGSPIWFCVSYAKDLQVARLAWMNHDQVPSLSELVDEVQRAGMMMYDSILNNIGRVEK